MAKITLIGMHNYTDGAIWENVLLPSDFNKEMFINTILLHYGEMETLYADPDMMKFAITNWANINNWNILKAITAINIEYEPLNNYDRTEIRSRAGTESGTNTGTVTDAGTTGETRSTSVSTTTRTVTDRDETNETEHKVSAYDSSSYSPDNTDDGSNTLDETVSGTGSSSGTDTLSGTSGNTRTDNLSHSKQENEQENIRAYGNIGVTTSQQMLQSELDIALYNIYETFAGIFAFDLLLMVY